jgi:hypothetical protein
VRKSTVAVLAAIAAVLVAPAAAAAQASLSVEPEKRCYRERETVDVPGSGITPNGMVGFTRDGLSLGDPIQADASGQLLGRLTLPDLVSGQRRLTYVGTDVTNPALTARFTVLVSAIDVVLTPTRGAPNRMRRIRARGFFGGSRLWAHIVRRGRPARTARNVRIGRINGACKKVRARKRLFPATAAPGDYRVQFDTFRRYRTKRPIEFEYDVEVFRS